MAVFVVFRTADPARVGQTIAEKYPGDHMDLGEGVWLISGKGTAKEISDTLGFSSATGGSAIGNGIVFRMDSYFGRAQTNIWDWIKVKIEAANG
jgi:hypothetical protein